MPQNSHTPPNPLTFPPRRRRPTRPSHPARYPRRSPTPPFPHSSPIQAPLLPQSEARHAPHFPTTQAQTRTAQPPSPLSSPLTNSPIPARLSYPSPLPKQSPAHPTLPHHTGTDTHGPATQPAIFPVHQLPHSRTALLSKLAPKAKPGTPHAFPPRRHRPTRPSRPARYPPRHQLPHSHTSLQPR